MTSQVLQTPADVRQWLERHGVTVTDWARSHGFDPTVVFALLNGRTKGRHGQAYQAAVALGLKAAPLTGEPHPLADDTVAPARRPPTAAQGRARQPEEVTMT